MFDYRLLSISTSLILLAKASFQYRTDADWWLYVPIYLLSAVLNLIPCNRKPWWRLFTSVIIVVGCAQIAFLVWSFRRVAHSLLQEEFKEARNILPLAVGVFVLTTGRLINHQHTSFLSYFRILIPRKRRNRLMESKL
ncbi:hypothetical protein AB6A40_001590 [Gnathostoma spinigerum]|uniref:Uncharacterized protein n=1 Tax=Gnathostoma spinigerum TaxID=75299 RepID=A0ABD6E6U4_9BILA